MHATARLCCASVAISRAWRSAHALWDAILSGALGGINSVFCLSYREVDAPVVRGAPATCDADALLWYSAQY